MFTNGNNICKDNDIKLRNVKEFIDGGLLEPLSERSLMIYEQIEDNHSQIGVCAAVDVNGFSNGSIKKKKTRVHN